MTKVLRADWPVARIDTGWLPVDLSSVELHKTLPGVAKYFWCSGGEIPSKLVMYHAEFRDFSKSGGGKSPPGPRKKIGWQRALLIDPSKDAGPDNFAALWVHPDLWQLENAPVTLAEFVPAEGAALGELISAREFLIMSDEMHDLAIKMKNAKATTLEQLCP